MNKIRVYLVNSLPFSLAPCYNCTEDSQHLQTHNVYRLATSTGSQSSRLTWPLASSLPPHLLTAHVLSHLRPLDLFNPRATAFFFPRLGLPVLVAFEGIQQSCLTGRKASITVQPGSVYSSPCTLTFLVSQQQAVASAPPLGGSQDHLKVMKKVIT